MATRFDGAIDGLERVCDRARQEGSRAGYFAAMYLGVTRTVARRAAAGAFDDPERMARFATAFVQRYLDAHDAWRAGRAPTASWARAFTASGGWRPVVLQHLLLGMNAHINLDLGIVAAELAGDAASLPSLRDDFDTINDVLGSMVRSCYSAVDSVSPWMGLLDRAGGRTDDEAIRFSLRVARTRAWEAAERLAATPPADRPAAVAALDESVSGVGRRVSHPGLWLGAVLLPIRLRERATPSTVIDALLAVGATADGTT